MVTSQYISTGGLVAERGLRSCPSLREYSSDGLKVLLANIRHLPRLILIPVRTKCNMIHFISKNSNEIKAEGKFSPTNTIMVTKKNQRHIFSYFNM